MKKISQTGIDLIKTFEGCRLVAYKPVSTEIYWTIGYGHYGSDVLEGMTITQDEAESILISDIEKYEKHVNNLNLQLNQGQFDALVSFCYNCGVGNLRNLCLGRTIEQIAENLPLYNKAGGVILAGLVRRRKAELDLYQKEDKEMNNRMLQLEAKIAEQDLQIKKLQEMQRMNEVPEWAKKAIENAVKNGLIDSPDNNSFDFYRIVTILYRAKLLGGEV